MANHILDNPIWHMFCHELADFTTGTARAKRGDPAMVPGAALVDHSDAAHADFASLFQASESVTLFKTDIPQTIPGFEAGDTFVADQLICQQRLPIPEHDVEIVELTPADVNDMIDLIALTQPGPFFPGLIGRRHFVGIRQNGQLVAMAGDRILVPGYSEISGVCTHPDWRGRGYARLLTLAVADGIWSRGEMPFLHVALNNTPAYRIYERLHFVRRTKMIGRSLTRL